MPSVEQADVLAAGPLHHPADIAGALRRGQQVHVIVHQHVGVQAHVRCLHDFARERQVAKAIAVVEKAGQAIVAALHDVLRYAG
jgi:predicted dinucleotide-binding enzyme